MGLTTNRRILWSVAGAVGVLVAVGGSIVSPIRMLGWIATGGVIAAMPALWPALNRGLLDADDAVATRRSLVVGFLLAAPTAMLLTVLGVAIVFLLRAPASGLVWESWRTLVDVRANAWFTTLLAMLPLLYASRPITASAISGWLERRRLPIAVGPYAARELRRTRLIRTVPAVTGLCVGAGTGSAFNLAVALDEASPAADALYAVATSEGAYNPFALAVVGYLVGIVAAEATRRYPRPGTTAGAQLHVRRPGVYLTRWAHRLPLAAAGLLVVVAGARGLVGDAARGPVGPSTLTVVAAVALLLIGVPAAQWWLVRRPQHHDDPTALALDDTFRSSAAHAIVGASVAGGLGVASGLLGGVWNAMVSRGHPVVMWMLVVIGLGLFAATIQVWLRYGSSHPGRRPAAGGAGS